jgi:hypothetical protein
MPRGRRRRRSSRAKFASADLTRWTLGGLEREIDETRQRLTQLTAEASRLRQQLKPATSPSAAGEAAPAPVRRRRRMSRAARKRISEMMKKRWAERKRRAGTK